MATNKIQTGLRLNEVVYEKAKVLATSKNRSLNNFIEYVLQSYIENYEAGNGAIKISPEE